jgi:hypothetical protein
VELRSAIRPAIPRFLELRKDQQPLVQLAAISALANLAEYGESQRRLIETLLKQI